MLVMAHVLVLGRKARMVSMTDACRGIPSLCSSKLPDQQLACHYDQDPPRVIASLPLKQQLSNTARSLPPKQLTCGFVTKIPTGSWPGMMRRMLLSTCRVIMARAAANWHAHIGYVHELLQLLQHVFAVVMQKLQQVSA